mmetsp:Transcript_49052/g.104421  ORF Transcript_49052/g.104421 Transcript_49052/m.104421 type:complete len:282 (+) Transcript_49052:433-1278(+)
MASMSMAASSTMPMREASTTATSVGPGRPSTSQGFGQSLTSSGGGSSGGGGGIMMRNNSKTAATPEPPAPPPYVSPHAWYDRHYDIPPGAVGVEPEDTEAMLDRLKTSFDPGVRADALKLCAQRNRGPLDLKSNKINAGDSAVEIMTKVFQEGQQMQTLQRAEKSTLRVLKNGIRDYIDYSLDEVERYAQVDKNGQVTSFVWRQQGHAKDNPALRRSRAEHSVSPDVLEALLFAKAKKRPSVAAYKTTSASEKAGDYLRDMLNTCKEARERKPDQERFGIV